MMTVRLTNGTVGKVDKAREGDMVTASLHDENGTPIEVTGTVAEILEES